MLDSDRSVAALRRLIFLWNDVECIFVHGNIMMLFISVRKFGVGKILYL